jgi:cytidine deaminase
MTDEELLQIAIDVRQRAYCPYSGFAVGAALLCDDGTVYTGVNIENAAFGPSICAERTAVFKAVSEGHRAFTKLAVVCDRNYCQPCGTCRQVLWEHAPELEILMGGLDGGFRRTTIRDLLPEGFRLQEEA